MFVEYESCFLLFKIDMVDCETLLLQVDVPKWTPPIALRQYHTSPTIFKQVDAILDTYLAAGLNEHPNVLGLLPR